MSAPSQRWLLPPVLVGGLALLGSIALHAPAYIGLTVLEAIFEARPAPAPAPVEFEILAQPSAPRDETVEPTPAPTLEPPPPEPDRAVPQVRQRREPAAAPPPPAARAITPPPMTPPTPVPPRPPPDRRATAVRQRSQDPSVPPPDEANFIADENNRVEEETLAAVRAVGQDAERPQQSASPAEAPAEAEGNATESERGNDVADNDADRESPRRANTDREREPARSGRPTEAEAARGDEGGGSSGEGGEPAVSAGGRRAVGGGETRPMREVVIRDATGSYVIRVPSERPDGSGPGEGGGPAVAGRGRGERGEGQGGGAPGAGRRAREGGRTRGDGAPNLRVSWSQFASLYGEDELRRERELYVERRRPRSRGANREERWQRFRAAMEHYDVAVRPGNQTALNTRADPFANYIATIHDAIHEAFAFGFLRSVPSTSDAIFLANPDMHTQLEIAVAADGSIVRVGIAATSGDTLFDFGAFNAVMNAAPFPPTPEAIRSPDGLVYIHWGFYRGHRQCGTFNAQGYILAHAPARRAPEGPVGERPRPIFQVPSPEGRTSASDEHAERSDP